MNCPFNDCKNQATDRVYHGNDSIFVCVHHARLIIDQALWTAVPITNYDLDSISIASLREAIDKFAEARPDDPEARRDLLLAIDQFNFEV